MSALQPLPEPARARALAALRPLPVGRGPQQAWRAALGGCRGLQGLLLLGPGAAPDLVELRLPRLLTLRTATPERLTGGLVCDMRALPILPGSIDAVFWVLHESHLPLFSSLMAELSVLLGPDGRLVIQAEAPLLDEWVRVGMPLCRHHDLTLCSEAWGDSRRLLHMPLRRYWSEGLQCWFPGMAQWSVQCWQKETLCPPRRRQQPVRARAGWRPGWLPQTRNPAQKESA